VKVVSMVRTRCPTSCSSPLQIRETLADLLDL